MSKVNLNMNEVADLINPMMTVYGKTGSGNEVPYNKMLIEVTRKYLGNGEILFMDMKNSSLLTYKKSKQNN